MYNRNAEWVPMDGAHVLLAVKGELFGSKIL
jgi:hypothetical protein